MGKLIRPRFNTGGLGGPLLVLLVELSGLATLRPAAPSLPRSPPPSTPIPFTFFQISLVLLAYSLHLSLMALLGNPAASVFLSIHWGVARQPHPPTGGWGQDSDLSPAPPGIGTLGPSQGPWGIPYLLNERSAPRSSGPVVSSRNQHPGMKKMKALTERRRSAPFPAQDKALQKQPCIKERPLPAWTRMCISVIICVLQ